MNRIARILLAAMAFWLLLVVIAHAVANTQGPLASRSLAWITREELRSLARFHGTEALKITESEVCIWREGEWIPVLKNERI